MPPRANPPRWRGLLRVVGVLAAFGLGILAVYLVAIGKSDKQHQLGIIAGLWSALVGAVALFGVRHPTSAGLAYPPAPLGTEIEMRESQGIETQREVAARRAYEQQLHALVRREMEHIQNAVGEQVAQLRADVAMLRGDLLEKLGGQIRLERIETTRLIGSEVEALSHEVRQMAVARGVLLPADIMDFGRHDGGADRGIAPQLLAPLGVSTRVESASERTDVHAVIRDDASDHVRSAPAAQVAPVHVAAVQPAPVPAAPPLAAQTVAAAQAVPDVPLDRPVAQPAEAARPIAATAAAATAPATAAPATAGVDARRAVEAPAGEDYAMASDGPPSSMGRDPFAGLPRLSRFAEADLGPLPTSKSTSEPVRPRGHHQAPDETEGETGGGRRRRAEGETNDILARLLSSR